MPKIGRPPHHTSGFTLLELLVVIVVLSIATGLIVVRGTPSPANHLQTEAKKLSQILRIAQQHALLKSQDIRFIAIPKGYTFEILEDNRWQPVTDESLLRARQWDQEGVRMSMAVDGQPVSFLRFEPLEGIARQTVTLGLGLSRLTLNTRVGGVFGADQPFEARSELPETGSLYTPSYLSTSTGGARR